MKIIHHKEAFDLCCPISTVLNRQCMCYRCMLWEPSGASFGYCTLAPKGFKFNSDGHLLVAMEEK
jgi:hypothetical protein